MRGEATLDIVGVFFPAWGFLVSVYGFRGRTRSMIQGPDSLRAHSRLWRLSEDQSTGRLPNGESRLLYWTGDNE